MQPQIHRRCQHATLLEMGKTMKIIGTILIIVGLALGVYALQMNVGVEVPSKDLGYGITTPAMTVANVDLISQRQNYLIFSGILSLLGVILVGFGVMAPKQAQSTSPSNKAETPSAPAAYNPVASGPVSITMCPKCRFTEDGNAKACGRCGHVFDAADSEDKAVA